MSILKPIRYKEPDVDKSSLITKALQQEITPPEKTSNNFRFASSAAEFGLLLRNSEYKGEASTNNNTKWPVLLLPLK